MKNSYLFFFLLLFFHQLFAQTNYIATIHPLQQIVQELVGTTGVVENLLPPGASPHTYESSPSDIHKIESADILFLVGPNLDDWIKKFPARRSLELISLIPDDSLIYFEKILGVEPVKNHADPDMPKRLHAHHHGLDPHFWTDPLLVKSLLTALTDTLIKLNPVQSQILRDNSIRFAVRLTDLDLKIRELMKPYLGKAVIQAHPFLNYFLRRYGLKMGGIVEINPGVDPSPRQLKNMIDWIRRGNISAIFTQPQLPDRAARLIGESTGIWVQKLDPIGGTPGRYTYEEILLYNTQLIIEALQ